MPGMALFEMRGRVKEVKANATKSQIDGFLNRRIRNVIEQRTWSDMLRIGQITFPAQYATGTVSLTPGSNAVVGSGTSWPVNDSVNTTLAAAVAEAPGYVEITPTAMTNIAVGGLLLLDTGVSQEIVVVSSVTPTTFWAYCGKNHSNGVALTQSSFAGRQFRSDTYVFTVTAVLSATGLVLDKPWGYIAENGVSYSIYQAYVSPSPTARRLKYCWDAIAGTQVGVDKTVEWLNQADPQRTDTGNQPEELVQTVPGIGGFMQWECYPAQTYQYQLFVIYEDSWPTLRLDNDLSPYFLNPEIFIAGACAEALMTKVIANYKTQDPYYDPVAAKIYRDEFAVLEDLAVQSDQGRYMTMLQDYRQQLSSARSYNWMRAHAVEAGDWGG